MFTARLAVDSRSAAATESAVPEATVVSTRTTRPASRCLQTVA